MIYKVAERFKSIQGEGVYAGTPMAFIRFVGCSVGKRVCQHCDTDFDNPMPWRGGGEFGPEDLTAWIHPYEHVCLTGGEPFDQDLRPLLNAIWTAYRFATVHVETSGTKIPTWWTNELKYSRQFWVCVSPKPGFRKEMIDVADEIKVIVPGLGNVTSAMVDERIRMINGEGYQCKPGEFEEFAKTYQWPDLQDALRWAESGKTVFLQPRNGKFDVDKQNLLYVQDLLRDHPNLRLSVQLHKVLKVQ